MKTGSRTCVAVFLSVLAVSSPLRGQLKDLDERAPLRIKDRCLVTNTDCDFCLAFSPDGKSAACAAPPSITFNKCLAELWKKIVIWDVVRDREVRVLTGHKHAVGLLAFSKDGKRLIGVAGEPSAELGGPSKSHVLVWELATGQLGQSCLVEGWPQSLSLHGKILATQSSGRVTVFDIEQDGKKLFAGESEEFALSPDGRLIATSSSGSVRLDRGADGKRITAPPGKVQVWDLVTGKEHASFEIEKQDTDRLITSFRRLFFSSDGKTLCGSCLQSRTYCWNVPEKKLLQRFDFQGRALSPDGRYLLGTQGRSEIALASLKSGKRVVELEFGDNDLNWDTMHFAIGADGSFAALGDRDEIRIWKLPKNLPE